VTFDTVKKARDPRPGQARAEGPREPAITRHALPEEIMSKLRPLLERNRVFAATGAHAGLAMKQPFGQRIVQSGEGRRVRLRPEVLP
jgi:hypothetical protein